MEFWKINCGEDRFPGLWQRWYREQCVAVGWPPERKFKIEGKSRGDFGWSRTRKSLREIRIGDRIIVQLKNHRIGRIGEVTRIRVGDEEWDPLVSTKIHPPHGEMGRRIEVRWDLRMAPADLGTVVLLPENSRFGLGHVRPTICKIPKPVFDRIGRAMAEQENWVSLLSSFAYEKALSDFIATFPHRLEDGLGVHPTKKIREHRFSDGTRADVVLVDRADRPVVVECKRGNPSPGDVKQLARYMRHIEQMSKSKVRGFLVHGGARKLGDDVTASLKNHRAIEVIRYRLEVDFDRCF